MHTILHDEIEEVFAPTCRHCKKTVDAHAQDKCFFEATTWSPMNPDEWLVWRREVLGVVHPGTDYLRDQLRKAGFAKKVSEPYSLGTKT